MDQGVRELGRAHAAQPVPPTERGELTRRHILDVAAKAFADKGYAGASLNDLIREAGVTKGGFYFHFSSKERLALDVLRYKQEQWAGRVVAATMRHTTAFDQMQAMVKALTDLHEQDPSSPAIGRLCMELAENPNLIPQLSPQFEVWVDMTSSLFAKAQEEGTVRTDLDPRAMGEAAVATFVGLEMMCKIEGRTLRPRVERYTDLFIRAFSAPDRPTP
jgi:AcrR family transcriptional regulator